jgi:hypothetical protein
VRLPRPRGPLSETAISALRGATPERREGRPQIDALGDDDLHLALYLCYELHYRSFDEVEPGLEWDPALLAFMARLEREFLGALIDSVPRRQRVGARGLPRLLFSLAGDDGGPPLSSFLEHQATLDQFREFVAHRSAYQLKEADPHTWAIPRLEGPPKSALVEVQADEYGSGRPERMHSQLFAKTMRAIGLSPHYGEYLDLLPGPTLATVNLMSLFGLHRRWRGAIVGHLALFEMTSPGPNRRYGNGLRRLGFGEDATDFFDEHVEADSVHENVAAHDLAGGLAQRDPTLIADVLFGADALLLLDRRFASRLLETWERGETSLLRPLGAPALSGA